MSYVLGFKKFVSNIGYEGELAICSETNDDEELVSKCMEGCARCKIMSRKRNENRPELHWKTVKGKFFMVSGANITCACARSPNGISPYSHIGDGYVNLVLVRHTSMLNNLRLLLRLSSKDKTVVSVKESRYCLL